MSDSLDEGIKREEREFRIFKIGLALFWLIPFVLSFYAACFCQGWISVVGTLALESIVFAFMSWFAYIYGRFEEGGELWVIVPILGVIFIALHVIRILGLI